MKKNILVVVLFLGLVTLAIAQKEMRVVQEQEANITNAVEDNKKSQTLILTHKSVEGEQIFQSQLSSIAVKYDPSIWTKSGAKYGAEAIFTHEEALPIVLFSTDKEKHPSSIMKSAFLDNIKSKTDKNVTIHYSKKAKINKKTAYLIKYSMDAKKGYRITYLACLMSAKQGSLRAIIYGTADEFDDYEEDVYNFISGITP